MQRDAREGQGTRLRRPGTTSATDRSSGRLRHPKRGITLAPFEKLSDPRLLAELAAEAEAAGWDGVFVWDHIVYSPPAERVADPWIALAAMATATSRVRLGPMVTPPGRRRPQKLSREIVTLDHLSGGRTIFGLGLGADRHGELSPFGDPSDPKELARLLDDALEKLSRWWAGELQPGPVQTPRIPIWLAGRYPNRRPLRRAAHWDGYFVIDLPGPEALTELKAALPARDGFDLVVEHDPGDDPEPWAAAGATWCLTGFSKHPTAAEVRAAIDG
jgi:alkanesulfonate monooxygenase SsuD/methylene tetrahydromethanopterin reductase-like flavin-dependent oxidoreductase (luciferase family)